jgi:hypothetical protein
VETGEGTKTVGSSISVAKLGGERIGVLGVGRRFSTVPRDKAVGSGAFRWPS